MKNWKIVKESTKGQELITVSAKNITEAIKKSGGDTGVVMARYVGEAKASEKKKRK